MDNLLSKGDVVKTSLSDSTLVLKVEGNEALLFTGSQFVVAHGVQKDHDGVFWNQGDYYDELPDNVFERGVQEEIPEQHPGEGKGFSYERFCEYVRSRLSIIYEGDQGEYLIMEDTDPLQEFGLMTEEETIKHIYDNNLFDQMEEIIRKSPAPYIYDSKPFEDMSKDLTKNLPYIHENNEDEDDWELEP